jgi:hypothetical protein
MSSYDILRHTCEKKSSGVLRTFISCLNLFLPHFWRKSTTFYAMQLKRGKSVENSLNAMYGNARPAGRKLCQTLAPPRSHAPLLHSACTRRSFTSSTVVPWRGHVLLQGHVTHVTHVPPTAAPESERARERERESASE